MSRKEVTLSLLLAAVGAILGAWLVYSGNNLAGAALLWIATTAIATLLFTTVMLKRASEIMQADFAARLHTIDTAIPKKFCSGTGKQGHIETAPCREPVQMQQAIESVRERVRATAEEQTRQIESLRLELNSDPITGVANRRYFLNALRQTLHGPIESDNGIPLAYGHVLIFRQRDLAPLNALYERNKTDDWLTRVIETVSEVLESTRHPERPVPQLARLNGSDFVVLLAGYDGPDTTDLIESLRQALERWRIRTVDDRLCRWSYALTDFAPNCDVSGILARLDHGLMRAENAGHDEVEYIASSNYRPKGSNEYPGESAWKELVQEALNDGRLELAISPVAFRGDDTPDRHEALLHLREKGDGASVISGYLFMPPAVRLGLSAECDLRAIELGVKWIQANPGHLALRVSLASMLQPGFITGMGERLATVSLPSPMRSRLTLEIDAHALVAYPDETRHFCEIAQRAGVGVGIRRLAEQPAALLRMHMVRLRYLKLGGDLIAGLLESPGAIQLIAAITEAAIGQGVKVYAHDVPNAPTASLLFEYGVLLPENEAFDPEELLADGGFVDN